MGKVLQHILSGFKGRSASKLRRGVANSPGNRSKVTDGCPAKGDVPKFPPKMEIGYWKKTGLFLQKTGPNKNEIGHFLVEIKKEYCHIEYHPSYDHDENAISFGHFVASYNKMVKAFEELFSLLVKVRKSRDVGFGYGDHIIELEAVAKEFYSDLNGYVAWAIESHNRLNLRGKATRDGAGQKIHWSPVGLPHAGGQPGPSGLKRTTSQGSLLRSAANHNIKKAPPFPKDLEVGDDWQDHGVFLQNPIARSRGSSIRQCLKELKKQYKLSDYDPRLRYDRCVESFAEFMSLFNKCAGEIDNIIHKLLEVLIIHKSQSNGKKGSYVPDVDKIEKAAKKFRNDIASYAEWAVESYNDISYTNEAVFF